MKKKNTRIMSSAFGALKKTMPSRRPVDANVAIARLMLSVTRMVHEMEPFKELHYGASLESQMVCMFVLLRTSEGKSLGASDIANELGIPRSNVIRHLKELIAAGRIKTVGRAYHSNLDGVVLSRVRVAEMHKLLEETTRALNDVRQQYQ
jgi:predicted transcriptional regulator